MVERAFVPSEKRPQGEVRLVRRDGQAIVQTVLYTRLLKRVLANITGKERRNWPPEIAGHDDMERYVAALEAYRQRATGEREAEGEADADAGELAAANDAPADDRRTTMIIEFVDEGSSTSVSLGGVVLEGSGDAIRVVRRETPVVLKLSTRYVRRNMELIVADAFQVTPEEAATRIARAQGP
jgi:hypothetical protein